MSNEGQGPRVRPSLAKTAQRVGNIPHGRQNAMLQMASQNIDADVVRREYQYALEFAQRIRRAIQAAASLSTSAPREPDRSTAARRPSSETYRCPFSCRATFNDLQGLKAHVCSSHCSLRCTVDGRSFDDLQAFLDHQSRTHHRRRSSSTAYQGLCAWEEREHCYALGCGICEKLFVRNSNEFFVHVLEHYRQGETDWQPTQHIRALLKEERNVEHWRSLTNALFGGSVPQPERLLRWDDNACEQFDMYLQRNAASKLLHEQMPLLLAAGLRYVEARSAPREAPAQPTQVQNVPDLGALPGRWPSTAGGVATSSSGRAFGGWFGNG